MFGEEMPNVANALRCAAEITATTANRLDASRTDAEVVERLGIEPHQFIAAQRAVRGADLMLVRLAA